MNERLKIVEPDFSNDPMKLYMGPSHPAMHGTVRMTLTLDGETVDDLDIEIGFLHRGFAKECENSTYHQLIPYTDRLNYVSPINNNIGYTLAVEKLLGIERTERCKFVSVILCELGRIMDHCTCIAAGALELGAMTAFLYMVEAREWTWDVLEEITGARVTTSFSRIGGLKYDLPDNFKELWEEIKPKLLNIHTNTHKLLTRNKIFIDRMKDVGAVSQEDALDYSFTGPVLRSTGVDYDIRKDYPYLAYDQLDFDVPVGTRGDNLDRYLVRMEEYIQSIKMIDQCIDLMPEGPINPDLPQIILPEKEDAYNSIEGMIRHFKLIFEGTKIKPGEVYHCTEGGNGELGFYIVADGTAKPKRMRCRPPCFFFMGGLHKLLVGGMLADIIPTFDTINMIGGEVDR